MQIFIFLMIIYSKFYKIEIEGICSMIKANDLLILEVNSKSQFKKG
jgi:hypothetical protein